MGPGVWDSRGRCGGVERRVRQKAWAARWTDRLRAGSGRASIRPSVYPSTSSARGSGCLPRYEVKNRLQPVDPSARGPHAAASKINSARGSGCVPRYEGGKPASAGSAQPSPAWTGDSDHRTPVKPPLPPRTSLLRVPDGPSRQRPRTSLAPLEGHKSGSASGSASPARR